MGGRGEGFDHAHVLKAPGVRGDMGVGHEKFTALAPRQHRVLLNFGRRRSVPLLSLQDAALSQIAPKWARDNWARVRDTL